MRSPTGNSDGRSAPRLPNSTLLRSSGLRIWYGGDEHDVIRCRDGGDPGLALGEKTELVPSHCDTAVNLYDVYHAVRGGQVEAVWPIEAPG